MVCQRALCPWDMMTLWWWGSVAMVSRTAWAIVERLPQRAAAASAAMGASPQLLRPERRVVASV